VETEPLAATDIDAADDDSAGFPDLLEDAFDAVTLSGEATLDELLENVGDEDDDLLIHDEMDGAESLEDLLGDDRNPPEKDDPLTADLSELVSDDYDDVLAHEDKSDQDGHDNRWALDLLGDEPEPRHTGLSDDLDGPDPDSFDDDYNSGISFSQIREQQQERNRRQFDQPGTDAQTDIAYEPAIASEAAAASTTDASESEAYVDDYVDDYQDDHAEFDGYATSEHLQPEVTDVALDSTPLPDEYDNLFADESEADRNINRDGMALDGNLSFADSVSLNIPNVVLDPVTLKPAPKKRSGIWWTLATVLLVIVAVAQLAWFRFDVLARDMTFRPYYTILCDVAGCSLPSIQDIRLIRTSNTVFNQHPTIAEGLVVDTLLTNMADHPQPYPDVRMEFRDLNDRLVAQRNLSPSEYLAGNVLPGDLMPPGIPVHIAVEVINPGPEAVSRRIQLLANQ
jgi:hypothetical protein